MGTSNIIVHMTFGSHLYGTNSPTSDHDYKGVFIPSYSDVLLQRVPHAISNHTKQGDGKNGVDDIDSELYSLHYFIDLACKGETVALDMLHAPSRYWLTGSLLWEELVAQRQQFYTKNLKAFVGYARRQAAKYGVKGSRLAEAKQVLEYLQDCLYGTRLEDVWATLPRGEHIHKSHNDVDQLYEVCGKKLTGRGYCHHYIPMLEAFIKQYGERARQAEVNEGVDWKAVSHAFRAAYQVKHILEDGGYTYPLPETDYLKAVKSGTLHFTRDVGPKLDMLMDEVEHLSLVSALPDQVDRVYWDNWLITELQEVYHVHHH